MGERRGCHDDVAGSLDGFGHVGRDDVDLRDSGPLEAVQVPLDPVQFDPRTVEKPQGFLGEGHHVEKAHLAPGQLGVGRAGLADGPAPQYGNRFLLQVIHISHTYLLPCTLNL